MGATVKTGDIKFTFTFVNTRKFSTNSPSNGIIIIPSQQITRNRSTQSGMGGKREKSFWQQTPVKLRLGAIQFHL